MMRGTLLLCILAAGGIMPSPVMGDGANSGAAPKITQPAQGGFDDPSFVDSLVRRRANYKIADFNGDTRILLLLAEAVTAPYDSDLQRVRGLQKWVCGTIPHVGGIDSRGRNDFYKVPALDIIRRGWSYCEGTAETFATLAWLAGFPSRVLSIQVESPDQAGVYGHHVNEVFLNGKWVFFDADLYRYFELPDGTPANALDLHRNPGLVTAAEVHRPQFDGLLSFLNTSFQDFYTKKNLFHTVYIQEGLYSVDGEYGRWIKLTPQTENYLYSGPKHPDVVRLVSHRIPFTYVRDTTKIEDHFDYRWEAPWGKYRDSRPETSGEVQRDR